MLSNTDYLIIYLETQMVLNNGLINQIHLSETDRKAIELWTAQGVMHCEQIPLPDRLDAPPTFTHKIRFTTEMWDLAAAARREKANINNPDVKEKPQKEITKEEIFPEKDWKGFLKAHGVKLTPPQEILAKKIFQLFNQKEYQFFFMSSGGGKSFLLKTIDQYITSTSGKREKLLKKKKFKIPGWYKETPTKN